MFDELPFINKGSVEIAKGTILTAYTDGVNELEAMDGSVFEDEYVADIIKKQQYKTMSELNMLITSAMMAHKGNLDYSDDIAIVSCKFF